MRVIVWEQWLFVSVSVVITMLRVDVIEMVVVFIFIHVVDLRIMLKGKEYEANLTVMEGGQINRTVSTQSAGTKVSAPTALSPPVWGSGLSFLG